MKKKLLIWVISTSIFTMALMFFPTITIALSNELDVNWFDIMPKLTPEEITDVNTKIEEIWNAPWEVRKKYNETANSSWFTTQKQIASWIMNRDTIMNYLVFIVKFLSQLWLLVWAWFIIYAWYKYMTSVFNWWKTGGSTLKNAVIWIVIVIFSYAIMRILTSIIWLT